MWRNHPGVDLDRRRFLAGAAGAAGMFVLGSGAPRVLAQALSPGTTAVALGLELNGQIVAWVQRVDGGAVVRPVAGDTTILRGSVYFQEQFSPAPPGDRTEFMLTLYGMSAAALRWIHAALPTKPLNAYEPDLALVTADAGGIEIQRILLSAPLLTGYHLEPINRSTSDPVRVRIAVMARPRFTRGSGRPIGALTLVEQPLQSNVRVSIGGLSTGVEALRTMAGVGMVGRYVEPPTNIFENSRPSIEWSPTPIVIEVGAPGLAGFYGWLEQLAPTTSTPLPLAGRIELLSADRRRLLGSIDFPSVILAGAEPPFPGGVFPGSSPLQARFKLQPLAAPVFNLSGMVTPA